MRLIWPRVIRRSWHTRKVTTIKLNDVSPMSEVFFQLSTNRLVPAVIHRSPMPQSGGKTHILGCFKKWCGYVFHCGNSTRHVHRLALNALGTPLFAPFIVSPKLS